MGQLNRKIYFSFVIIGLLAAYCMALSVPHDNPVSKYKLKWTDDIRWSNVVLIIDYQGKTLEERFTGAQADLAAKGGGVVYFPPGVYTFKESLYLKDGVVIRGAGPDGLIDA